MRYFAYATYKSLFKFISEGIGGSRETPAYCFFIINSEKSTDDSHGVAELSASGVIFGTLRCNI